MKDLQNWLLRLLTLWALLTLLRTYLICFLLSSRITRAGCIGSIVVNLLLSWSFEYMLLINLNDNISHFHFRNTEFDIPHHFHPWEGGRRHQQESFGTDSGMCRMIHPHSVSKCLLSLISHFQYEDEDGDKVILASDSDLAEAVDHARLAGWKAWPPSIFFSYWSQ